ncbi:MAG: histidine kinase [Methylotenera sp. 24-45-7]|jgi:CBS domain-containing protein|nr:MAG: histidine kinase [Methylotenera sp. 24-45-7]OZA08672.1 MAG: histidine kinase [Methylotenera sp. 17-45-7]
MKTLQQLIDNKKHKDVITVAPHRPVFDALVILAEYQIGALVVVENAQMVGIFSERDYAREVILKGRSSKTTQISDVMTHNVIFAKPEDSVQDAMAIMTSKNFRHLPVVDNGKVVGIMSLGDLAKETIQYQQDLIAQLEQRVGDKLNK